MDPRRRRRRPDAFADGHYYDPRFDDDGVHEIHRMIRKVLDEYPDAMAVGEIWVDRRRTVRRYLRPDELHLGFNFRLVRPPFDADAVRDAIEHSLDAVANGRRPGRPGRCRNHDVVRHGHAATAAVRRASTRARAMALVELALPGVVYLYNGEELGLPNVELPDWALQDPIWARSGHTERGRDGARVPMPWEGDLPPFGFSAGRRAPGCRCRRTGPALTVEAQLEDAGSMLSLYRQALELRRRIRPSAATSWSGTAPRPGCFAFRRKGGGLVCALNTSARPAAAAG